VAFFSFATGLSLLFRIVQKTCVTAPNSEKRLIVLVFHLIVCSVWYLEKLCLLSTYISYVAVSDSICFTRQNTSSAVPLTIPPSCKKFQSVITLDEAPPLVVYNAENHEASFVDGDFCEVGHCFRENVVDAMKTR